MSDNRQLILGIDPGYDRCGWAVVASRLGRRDSAQLVQADYIQTNRQASKTQRFAQIWQHLQQIFTTYPITTIAMESLFFSRNVSTALPVSEVRGLVYAQALQHQVPLFEYKPAAIKMAVTGYGRADKQQVMRMVVQLLKLEKIPNIDDTGDAIAVAITHTVSAQSYDS